MSRPARTGTLLGLDPKEWIVLCLYTFMLVFCLIFYQQSEDEGQAWIIVRTYGIGELLFHMLRILGHPALYYLLLWLPAHLGVPLTQLNWPFAIIAAVGIYLLLRYSPFPFYLRAVLPFGFALGYQYAVVARSYVLIPILGFLVAHFYRERPRRPLAIAICLGLLANVSLHGTMIAIGFAIAYVVRFLRLKKSTGITALERRQAWTGLCIFAGSILFVTICIWPAKYLHLNSVEVLGHVARRILGPIDKGHAPHLAGVQPEASPTASATPITPTPSDQAPQATLGGRLWLTLAYPIAAAIPVAVALQVLLLVYLLRRRLLVLVLPFALLAYFLLTVYEQVWHVELVWVTLVLVLWAAWDETPQPQWYGLQNCVGVAVAVVAALQVPWTVGAIRYNMKNASYPAKATAEYLRTLPPGLRIDGNGLAFRVLPYFPNYIYVDHGSARFDHAGEPPPPLPVSVFANEHADVVLIRDADITGADWEELTHDGYTVHRYICGAPYFPNRPIKPICMSVFQK